MVHRAEDQPIDPAVVLEEEPRLNPDVSRAFRVPDASVDVWKLVWALARGAQEVRPGTTVLRAWSRDDPASCKEAALGALSRGAVAIMAHRGSCAAAAVAGAHQQNVVGLRIADFELSEVAAETAVRDAVAGVYRGGEDVVLGAASGAIGVRQLDPRVAPDLVVRVRTAAQDLAEGRRPSGR